MHAPNLKVAVTGFDNSSLREILVKVLYPHRIKWNTNNPKEKTSRHARLLFSVVSMRHTYLKADAIGFENSSLRKILIYRCISQLDVLRCERPCLIGWHIHSQLTTCPVLLFQHCFKKSKTYHVSEGAKSDKPERF
jgi:hypothetical protein